MKILLNDQQKMNEIIFANRNKSYGAYVIRASYNTTLFRALAIVTSSMLAFMFTCYALTHRESPGINHFDTPFTYTTICTFNPPDTKKTDPPKANPPKTPKAAGTSTVVRDTVDDPRPEVAAAKPGSPSGNDSTAAPEPFVGGPSGGGTTPAPEKKEEAPTLIPDEPPVFEGGPSGLANYLSRNTMYPAAAVEVNLEGTVYVSFVVNEKGYIEGVKVIKGIGMGCDEEAARVVSKIPKAVKPGTVAGRPVKVQYNVPIKFRLK